MLMPIHEFFFPEGIRSPLLMMQKCSELGNNPDAWQQLFRFGKNRLKVKKGPDGHYLEQECRDELQKTLPSKAFDSLMSSVATWMARLDEKDKKVQRQRKTAVRVPKKLPVEQTSEDGVNNKINAVVDLCSDVDKDNSLDTFNAETVLLESSVIIIDDDLGEVNLKDFADHVEGKLDVQTLKRKKQDTTQESIEKCLSPRKADTLQRSLKTYARKRNSTEETIAEALRKVMTTNKDPKILREINREASREAGQKSTKTDCQDPKVDKEVTPDEGTTLVSVGNSQQKLQIVTEPTAYYNLETKPGVEYKLKQSELESNSDVERKTEPEIRTNAKENTPKKGFNLEQAYGERTKEGDLPEDSLRSQKLDKDDHAPQIRIRTDLGPPQRDVIRVRTDLLLDQPPEQSRSPLGNQSPSAETIVPKRTANKRILEAQSSKHPPKRPALASNSPQYSVAAPSSSCHGSISITSVSNSGYPISTPSSQRNPAPVGPLLVKSTAARPPKPTRPTPPTVTVKYKLNHPKPLAPATSTITSTSNTVSSSYQGNVSKSCQPNLTSTTSHSYNSVNSALGSSGSHMGPVTGTLSHQPNNPANRAPITNGRHPSSNPMRPPPAPSSNYSTVILGPATAARSAPSPIIPMMNHFPPINQYQPSMPMPAAPVRISIYPPGAPAAPVPPSRYAPVTTVAPAPATVVQPRSGAAVLNPEIDLARVMGMLSDVEVFAYRQKNREAFELITKLRKSLQR